MGNGGFAYVMESSLVYMGYCQYPVELLCKIVDYLVSCVRKCPLALRSPYLLNTVVSIRRNQDVWVMLRSSALEIYQQLADVLF